MDDIIKMDYPHLPPKEAFYSKLSGCGISDEDYERAKKVWVTAGCKTFKDYHELYNIVDVLLLADVFESFRNVCMENYKLDPAHYFTAPGLAWDAMLKMTGVSLELLNDVDMLLLFEELSRGGISMISNRYARANNKYMGEKFNKNEKSEYIFYIDQNNLYGYIMSGKLPISDFEWLSEDELKNLLDKQTIENWEKTPCIVVVDLKYPKELHDFHNDLPLCPEKLIMKNKIQKLIPNLNNKEKYVIHYRTLLQCLELGMELKYIHSGIKFKESDWLKIYIETNTKLRTNARNNFEKDFFKLMNNSVFGKTMENIRNRVDIKLINNREKAKKLCSKPNYKHCNPICEGLVAIHMTKTHLTMVKPIYVGATILDLSKIPMYNFHYNYFKPKYGDKATLMLMDTDSFIYRVETEDIYKDISEDVDDWFDTSNYPPNHASGIPVGINKKVLGKMKDEAEGKIIEEFVGLRPKSYSYKFHEGSEEKKCKGIKKPVVKTSITHEDYKTCLFTKRDQLRKQNIIKSYKHEVYTEEVNKIALSAKDDKRYILEDGIHTLAIGHYKLNE